MTNHITHWIDGKLVEGTSGRFVLSPDLSFGRGEWPAGADRGAPMVVTVQLEQIIPAP